jgi:hypothetical protein
VPEKMTDEILKSSDIANCLSGWFKMVSSPRIFARLKSIDFYKKIPRFDDRTHDRILFYISKIIPGVNII